MTCTMVANQTLARDFQYWLGWLDAMDDQEDTQEIIEQKLINEEYKIWKKNTPFLYDMLWA